MNSGLKSVVKVVFDLVKVGKAAIEKQDFVTGILPTLYSLAADVPQVVGNFGQILPDLKAIGQPGFEPEADLIGYVSGEFAGVVSDDHAKKIVNASLKLAVNTVDGIFELLGAIKE